jgi:hypothetical protein
LKSGISVFQNSIISVLSELKVINHSLIRPLTEYSAVIWDPHTAENIRKLEMIQRRAARMVYVDYQTTSSVSTMLNQLQWTTLQERRAQAKACMMYRVVNQLIDTGEVFYIQGAIKNIQ